VDRAQNNFIALITPYLNNSSNWHIREELLNVLIISFLKARSMAEFDPIQICDSIIRLLNDQKERIQLVAMETIAAFVSIGEIATIRDIISQIVVKENLSPYLLDRIASRLNYELPPIINP
jgi:hypothetical protein